MLPFEIYVIIAELTDYSSFRQMRIAFPKFDEYVMENAMYWILHFNLQGGFTEQGDYNASRDDVTVDFGLLTSDPSRVEVAGSIRQLIRFNSFGMATQIDVYNGDKVHVTVLNDFGYITHRSMFVNGEVDGVSTKYSERGVLINTTWRVDGQKIKTIKCVGNGVEEIRNYQDGYFHGTDGSFVIRGKEQSWADKLKSELWKRWNFRDGIFCCTCLPDGSTKILVQGTGLLWMNEFDHILGEMKFSE